MTLQRWVFLRKLTAAAAAASAASSSSSSPFSPPASLTHVLRFSQSAAVNMAEEAKKLAAYSAVDNNVQVQRTSVSLLANKQTCSYFFLKCA